ncbi:MAG TPA: DUF423 domain-containing protein [Actinomycetota bacterium]
MSQHADLLPPRASEALPPEEARGERLFFVLGAAFAGLAILIGAFGAHALRGHVSADRYDDFVTGARYHLPQALGLFAVSRAAVKWPGRAVAAAGWLFVAGIVLFSGSLYLLGVTGQRWLGAITPLGGLAFIAGWALLARQAWSAGRRTRTTG